MPEYVLPISNPKQFNALDSFVQGYIEAAFFTDCSPDNPELEHATTGDIAPSALKQVVANCEEWQSKNAALLEEAYERDYDHAQAGRDYWFTRNGHGVGFWDRKPLVAEDLGDRLSDACRGSESCVYRGDNGLIYFA